MRIWIGAALTVVLVGGALLAGCRRDGKSGGYAARAAGGYQYSQAGSRQVSQVAAAREVRPAADIRRNYAAGRARPQAAALAAAPAARRPVPAVTAADWNHSAHPSAAGAALAALPSRPGQYGPAHPVADSASMEWTPAAPAPGARWAPATTTPAMAMTAAANPRPRRKMETMSYTTASPLAAPATMAQATPAALHRARRLPEVSERDRQLAYRPEPLPVAGAGAALDSRAVAARQTMGLNGGPGLAASAAEYAPANVMPAALRSASPVVAEARDAVPDWSSVDVRVWDSGRVFQLPLPPTSAPVVSKRPAPAVETPVIGNGELLAWR